MLSEGCKQIDVANELGVAKSTISSHKKMFVEKGYLDTSGKITEKGQGFLTWI